MRLAVDHLVLGARTLDEGVAWCEATLGVRAEAGGRHAFMGTHNRVFAIGSEALPRAYFEVIAIDPDAPRPAHPRWFDLDDPALQARLASDGPQLVHWVASSDDIDATHTAMRAAGVDCGVVRTAERMTPTGLLRWRIGIRADGRRALAGAVPALIEWGDTHPGDSLPASGVALRSMRVAAWPDAVSALRPTAVGFDASPGAVPISAVLDGPRGAVVLEAPRVG